MPYYFVDREAAEHGAPLVHDWNACKRGVPEIRRHDLGWHALADDAVLAASQVFDGAQACPTCTAVDKDDVEDAA